MYAPTVADLGGVGEFEFKRPGDTIEGWVVDMIGWVVDYDPFAVKIKTDRGTYVVRVLPRMGLLRKHLYKRVRITYLGKDWDARYCELVSDFALTVLE